MREAGWRTGWDCENTLWRVFVLGQKPSDRLVALGAQNAVGVLSNMGSFTAPNHPPTNEPPIGGSFVGGGQGGIRTHETVSRPHAFQACAFSHSATCPHKT